MKDIDFFRIHFQTLDPDIVIDIFSTRGSFGVNFTYL